MNPSDGPPATTEPRPAPRRPRTPIWGLAVPALALALLGFALWERVADLPTIPGIGGDEAWYGVQMGRFVAGRAYDTRTPTGLPLNPFFAWLEVPSLLVSRPRGWFLRAPAVLSGVLAIVAAFGLLARPLGRTAAAVAGLTLAALPVAVLFSRLGWDQCQAPLFGILVVAFALRGQPIALALASYAFLWVHPVNVIALPAAALPFLVVAWRKWPRWRWLALVGTAAGLALLAWMASGTNTQPVLVAPADSLFSAGRWRQFLARFGRFASGDAVYDFYAAPPDPWLTSIRDILFWALAIGVTIAGGVGLARRSRWDQLALVGGVLGSVIAFGVVAGPNGVKPELIRYPMSLVGPGVAAFACLVVALLRPGDATRPDSGRARVLLTLLGMILVLPLVDFDRHFLGAIRADGGGHGSPRFRAGPIDPKEIAANLVAGDLVSIADERGTLLRRSVLAEDYWVLMPLTYFALDQPKAVLWMNSGDPKVRREEFDRILRRGGLFVGFAGGHVEQELLAHFAGETLERREVDGYGGRPALVLYRLREP